MSIPRCFPLLILLVLLGCGDGRVKLPTALVAGTVTYQGKPLGTGRIIFFHPSGQAVATDLSADGTYELAAFLGNNRVAITSYLPEQPDANFKDRGRIAILKNRIPDRYAEPATSGLTFEVKPRENEKADFSLVEMK
ncbi:MAG: hypothetical protein JXM70_06990 [Pirellulales bacterium]|nr:hypothetical protein [Pirellulales bacterium]